MKKIVICLCILALLITPVVAGVKTEKLWTVTIISPVDGAVCSGTILISWIAGGVGPILPFYFHIYCGGQLVAIKDSESEYCFWNSEKVSNGPCTITVQIMIDTDLDGHGDLFDTSDSVQIIVQNNKSPNAPNTPSGATQGKNGISYAYSTSTIDNEGDKIYYWWDWADGTNSGWDGPYTSGITVSKNYIWSIIGIYAIKVKAKDEHGLESGWSSPLIVTISAANNPPNKPNTPIGPSSGKPGTSYSYSSSAIDPDGDQVYLMFDWGDETPMVWKGPFNSGYVDTESHIWNAKGAYSVKVQAKDTKDGISVWSDSLPITMPYSFNKLQILELLFQRSPNAFPLLRPLMGY